MAYLNKDVPKQCVYDVVAQYCKQRVFVVNDSRSPIVAIQTDTYDQSKRAIEYFVGKTEAGDRMLQLKVNDPKDSLLRYMASFVQELGELLAGYFVLKGQDFSKTKWKPNADTMKRTVQKKKNCV